MEEIENYHIYTCGELDRLEHDTLIEIQELDARLLAIRNVRMARAGELVLDQTLIEQ